MGIEEDGVSCSVLALFFCYRLSAKLVSGFIQPLPCKQGSLFSSGRLSYKLLLVLELCSAAGSFQAEVSVRLSEARSRDSILKPTGRLCGRFPIANTFESWVHKCKARSNLCQAKEETIDSVVTEDGVSCNQCLWWVTSACSEVNGCFAFSWQGWAVPDAFLPILCTYMCGLLLSCVKNKLLVLAL